MVGYWHICSKPLEKGLLFKDEEDFIHGCNSLMLSLLKHPSVKLYAYCLMNNHIHTLLSGPREDCEAYFETSMHRISLQLSKHHGDTGLVKTGAKARTCVRITNMEHFRTEVLYILRNPFRARICFPGDWRWSSISCYFSNKGKTSGRLAGSFRVKELRALLKTNVSIPDSWEITADGRIVHTPICTEKVEAAFSNDETLFLTRLMESVEYKVELRNGLEEELRFSDDEMRAKMLAVCRRDYDCEAPSAMDRKTLLALARTLRFRYGATAGQLQRLLGLDKTFLERIL